MAKSRASRRKYTSKVRSSRRSGGLFGIGSEPEAAKPEEDKVKTILNSFPEEAPSAPVEAPAEVPVAAPAVEVPTSDASAPAAPVEVPASEVPTESSSEEKEKEPWWKIFGGKKSRRKSRKEGKKSRKANKKSQRKSRK